MQSNKPSRVLACILACCIVAWPGYAVTATEATPWREAFYNPKAAQADFVLPMPCGGSMVFRAVRIAPAEELLDDRTVLLGGSDERYRYAENTRYEHIAGGFRSADSSTSHYYLAKYETTSMQWDALMGSCPKPSIRGRLPKTKVDWFDAVDYARRYTEWLLANAADSLPRQGKGLGVLRLPTETEWEYAARGGIAVSESQFVDRTFPMPKGMEKYVWFSGTRSANGKLRPTGLHLPNPLGLHDMLGNAAEIVLDPFRLNHRDRLHGQAGGYIIKGGHYLTSKDNIRSAYRQEIPRFDTKGRKRVSTNGFRLVIAPPAINSQKDLQRITREWQGLTDPAKQLAATDSATMPTALADAARWLGATATDPETRMHLETLALRIDQEIIERNLQRKNAVKSLIRLGAFLGDKVRGDDRILRAKARLFTAWEKSAPQPDAVREKRKRKLDKQQEIFRNNARYYLDNVAIVAAGYTDQEVSGALRELGSELEARKLTRLMPYAEFFVAQVSAHQRGDRKSIGVLVSEIIALGEK